MISYTLVSTLKRLGSILFFTGLCFISFCQIPASEIIPPSPEAASLGEFGEHPTSLYNGTATVSVPLHSINYKGIQVPVTLNYQTMGIKVQQESSWVGLGWTLSAGGVITRQIKGFDDLSFDRTAHIENNFIGKGYPIDTPLEWNLDENNDAYASIHDNILDQGMYNQPSSEDTEPDMFYFNFLGRSGKFILRQDQTDTGDFIFGDVLGEDDKLTVKFYRDGHRFEILTGDGSIYDFRTKEITFNVSAVCDQTGYDRPPWQSCQTTGSAEQNDNFHVTAWYLDKVTNSRGYEVLFSYAVPANNATMAHDNPEYASRYLGRGIELTSTSDDYIPEVLNHTGSTSDCIAGTSRREYRSFAISAYVYLESISYGNRRLEFNKSNRQDIQTVNPNTWDKAHFFGSGILSPQKLNSIQELEGLKVLRTLVLDNSYFHEDVSGTDMYNFRRLKLDRVYQDVDLNSIGDEIGTYSFDYSDIELPSKSSFAVDFWGYYNGRNSNTSGLPKIIYYDDDQTNGGVLGGKKVSFLGNAEMSPSIEYAEAGILRSVTYPTGGSTAFEYELHDFYDMGAFPTYGVNGNEKVVYYRNIMANTYTATKPFGSTTDEVLQFTVDEESYVSISNSILYSESSFNNETCVVDPTSNCFQSTHGFKYDLSDQIYVVRGPSGAVGKSLIIGNWLNRSADLYDESCDMTCSGTHRKIKCNSPMCSDSDISEYVLPAGTYEVELKGLSHFNMGAFVKVQPISSMGLERTAGDGVIHELHSPFGSSTDNSLQLNLTEGTFVTLKKTYRYSETSLISGESCVMDPTSLCYLNTYGYDYDQGDALVSIQGSNDFMYEDTFLDWLHRSSDYGGASCGTACSGSSPKVQCDSPMCLDTQEETFFLTAGTYDINVLGAAHINSDVTIEVLSVSSSNTIKGGGLRIKKMESSAGNGSDAITRNYSYTKTDGTSSGKLTFTPTNYLLSALTTQNTSCQATYYLIKGTSASHIPMGTTVGGSHVGYDRVVEVVGDGSYGHTVSEFFNDVEYVLGGAYVRTGNGPDVEIPSLWIGQPNIQNTRNGLLKDESQFDSDGNIVSQRIISYGTQPINETTYNYPKGLLYSGNGHNFYASYYEIKEDRWAVTSEESRQYFGDQNIVETTTTYTYDLDNHKQITNVVRTGSDGLSYEDAFLYNSSFDVDWITSDLEDDGHIYSLPAMEIKLVDDEITRIRKHYYEYSGPPVLTQVQEALDGINYEVVATTSDYDDNGNSLEVTGRDGITICYLWGYNGEYPIAQITNTTIDAIEAKGISLTTRSEGLSEDDEISLRGISGAYVTTFTYELGRGISTVTDSNGNTLYYEYDAFGRLFRVRDYLDKVIKQYEYNYAND